MHRRDSIDRRSNSVYSNRIPEKYRKAIVQNPTMYATKVLIKKTLVYTLTVLIIKIIMYTVKRGKGFFF